MPLRTYLLSAWVKEVGKPLDTYTYTAPKIEVRTPLTGLYHTVQADAKSPMVEGWQLIESEFTMPTADELTLSLVCGTGDCLFDDIRIFPSKGSMKSYVYDPENLRFLAELDERHFAKLYEYDNEGKLVRVKKETERGIMTIQESRQNSIHTQP